MWHYEHDPLPDFIKYGFSAGSRCSGAGAYPGFFLGGSWSFLDIFSNHDLFMVLHNGFQKIGWLTLKPPSLDALLVWCHIFAIIIFTKYTIHTPLQIFPIITIGTIGIFHLTTAHSITHYKHQPSTIMSIQ